MAAQLDTSKIDGLVEVGLAAASEGVSAIKGMVMIGAPAGNLEVAKIDSFAMVQVLTVQHEHLWTDQWIGPPGAL